MFLFCRYSGRGAPTLHIDNDNRFFEHARKDTEDAFYTAWRALNLAEKYQTPILILSDLFLSEHFQTVDSFRFDMPIDRGKFLRAIDDPSTYKRYQLVSDGVSPRLIPGVPGGMYCSASDEHMEDGTVISDVLAGLPDSLDIRNKMHAKRMKKLDVMRKEDMQVPTLTGPKQAELTLMGWGSTYDALEEALQFLSAQGIIANHLHFTDLFPLPVEGVLEIMNGCKEIVAVENNFSCQMARLIRAETGYYIKKTVTRFDGEPFTGEDICSRVIKLKKELAHV